MVVVTVFLVKTTYCCLYVLAIQQPGEGKSNAWEYMINEPGILMPKFFAERHQKILREEQGSECVLCLCGWVCVFTFHRFVA